MNLASQLFAPASAKDRIRVLIVDDHRSVLWGLGKLVESAASEMELVAAVTNGKEALDALHRHQPDVVLLDLDLGEESGLDLLSKLRDQAAVVIVTGSRNLPSAEELVMAGARGLIHKSEPAEVILKAIARVHAGDTWLDRSTMSRLLSTLTGQQKTRGPYDALTPAERKVVSAVLDHKGAPNKVIAASLHLSEHTLRNHLASIYSKLGIKRRAELVFHASEHRLR